MKSTIQILLITFILVLGSNSYAITGTDAISKFQSRMRKISTLAGSISIINDNSYTVSGNFKYMNPGKIYIKFTNPNGKILVSNSEKLWIFDSANKICGVQDLGLGMSGGVASFVNGYMAIVKQNGDNYTIKLKNEEKYYTEVILTVDSTFFLQTASLKRKDGSGFTFKLSNIDKKAPVVNNIFEYKVPANTQIIKNPLNIK